MGTLTRITSALAYEKVKNLGITERNEKIIMWVLRESGIPMTSYQIAKRAYYEVKIGTAIRKMKLSYNDVARRTGKMQRDEKIEGAYILRDDDGAKRTAYRLA
jgi:hypothetical protein